MSGKVECNLKIQKDEEDQKLCLVNLKNQIEGITNLKNIWTEDRYLLRFLYSTEFNVDEAFKRLKGYHEHMTECPQLYRITNPLKIKRLIEKQICTLLQDCDREGRPIFIVKPANINTNDTIFPDLVELDENWFEYVLWKNPEIAGKGLCYIFDLKNHNYSIIKWFNISTIKMCMKKISNIPFKEFIIHIVNKSFITQALSKIVLTWIPESRKKQLKFHFTNWDSLHQYVDPKILPAEYGGTKEINHADIYQKLYEYNDDILRSFESARRVKKN